MRMRRYYSPVILWLISGFATAAVPTPAMPIKEMNFLELVAQGGFMMYPMALMSVITVILIFIFVLTIRRNAVISDRFMNHVETLISKRDFSGLLTLSSRRNECMARIAEKTLSFLSSNPTASFESVKEVAQVEGSHQVNLLVSRVSYLADIGSIAPMVGLLGTVFGMIEAFLGISSGQVAGVREMGLADGVSKALIATAGGLAISIPAFAFYSIFRGRLQRLTSELESGATHFIALLQLQLDRQVSTPAQSPQAYVNSMLGPREDYAMPSAFPSAGDRPDLHGI
jgi:biopolymer transport protein ExbB